MSHSLKSHVTAQMFSHGLFPSVSPISISFEIKDALWILDDSSWVLDDLELLDKLSSPVALGTTWKSRKR